MALKGIFSYNGLDNTNDLNALNAKIIDRGIFDGGSLILSGTSLQVSIPPFVAVGYDGMVVTNDAIINVAIPADSTNYLICFAKWVIGSQPIIEIQLVNSVTWLTSINKNYFITFAKLVVPAGVTSILSSYVDWNVSDYADKAGKIGWRPSVISYATLPSVGNRSDDVRLADHKPYYWDPITKVWKVVVGIGPTDDQLQQIPFIISSHNTSTTCYFSIPYNLPYFETIPPTFVWIPGSAFIPYWTVNVTDVVIIEVALDHLVVEVTLTAPGSFHTNLLMFVGT